MVYDLDQWRQQYPEAAKALAQLVARVDCEPDATGKNEGYIQNKARVMANSAGILWRNNVGALKDDRGVPVRYGLMNDNAAINKVLKSPDLIGIKRVVIQPEHVGQVIGQFWARECKRPDWVWSGNKHEIAQFNAINLIRQNGGDADFYNGGPIL